MSQDQAIHCPKCKEAVLEANYPAHVASGHKDHILKLDREEQKKLGNPLKAEIMEMLKAYPRAFFVVLGFGLLAGLVMEYYWLVR